MEGVKTITGTEALRRMRLISKVKDASFEMIHFTCDYNTGEGGEMRKVSGCRLRGPLPKGLFIHAPEHYVCYTDGQSKEPRMCFRKLIRYVAFPPHYETLKIDWINKD